MKSVLVFAPFYPPAFLGGGPIRTISALAQGAPPEYQPIVLTSDTDLGEDSPLPVASGVWTQHKGVKTLYFSTNQIRSTAKAFGAGRRTNPDFIYLSSFFNVKFSILPQLLRRLGYFGESKVVIAPRGEFGSAALSIKPRRKQIFIGIYRKFGQYRGVVWHASSTLEAEDIRKSIGSSARILVRENDSSLPAVSRTPGVDSSSEGLRAVFVGRIAVVKGLLDLLKALKTCSIPLTFDIFGPEEDSIYTNQCRAAARDLPRHVSVKFNGAVPHDQVQNTLGQYDVMLFPTRGENFGHVIAESLSVACPVVCSDVTPWTATLDSGGGYVVYDNSAKGWLRAIEHYGRMSPQERLATREQAGQAYNEWRQAGPEKHIFQMVDDHLAG